MTAADALTQHLAKHRRECMWLALRICRNQEDAEDAVQQASLRVLQTKSPFVGESSFGTWFYRVLTNACLESIRKRTGAGKREFVELPENLYSCEPSCHDAAVARERAALVLADADKLSPRLRQVFAMYFLHEMTTQEIAAEIGMTNSSAKSALHRLREELVRR